MLSLLAKLGAAVAATPFTVMFVLMNQNVLNL